MSAIHPGFAFASKLTIDITGFNNVCNVGISSCPSLIVIFWAFSCNCCNWKPKEFTPCSVVSAKASSVAPITFCIASKDAVALAAPAPASYKTRLPACVLPNSVLTATPVSSATFLSALKAPCKPPNFCISSAPVCTPSFSNASERASPGFINSVYAACSFVATSAAPPITPVPLAKTENNSSCVTPNSLLDEVVFWMLEASSDIEVCPSFKVVNARSETFF